MLNLLHNIPSHTYRAYFPDAPTGATSASVCAEDPARWHDNHAASNAASNAVQPLSRMCVRSLARFFSRAPAAGLSLRGRDKALFYAFLSTDEPIGNQIKLFEMNF